MKHGLVPRWEGGSARLLLAAPEGWVRVGGDLEADEGHRRPHWCRMGPLALRASTAGSRRCEPYVTGRLLRDLMIGGRYHWERQADPRLRLPDDVIGARAPAPDEPVRGLRWLEARAVCRLLGGRLPLEKELDALIHTPEVGLDRAGAELVWTASRWSEWSYSLCRYHPERDRWESPEVDRESGVADAGETVTALELGRVVRRPVEPDAPVERLATVVVFDA